MADLENFSDEMLLCLLQQESMDAFDELYSRHWQKLYTAAYKRIRSKEISEEIVQDFFTRLWIKRKELKVAYSFEAYLYTSIRYLVINHIQKELVRNRYKNVTQLTQKDYDTSTEDTLAYNNLQESLQKEISRLPEKCRSVFELSRKDGKSNKEIARQLEISEKTVENHITKALRRLKLGLNEIISILILILIR